MNIRDWFWRGIDRLILGPETAEPMSRSRGWTQSMRATINTDGQPYQEDVLLMYWESQPYEVVAGFAGGKRWKFARELLTDGLCIHAGRGDVRFVPFAQHVRMVLRSPDGMANVIFRRRDLIEFLDTTYDLVPEHEEHIDIPDNVSSLEGAMSRFDVEALEAVSEHSRRHGLEGSIISLHVAGERITVNVKTSYGDGCRGGIARFKAWARSTGAFRVVDLRNGTLCAHGNLDDDQEVTVQVTVFRRERPETTVTVALEELGEVA